MLWAGNVLKPAPTAFVGHPDSLMPTSLQISWKGWEKSGDHRVWCTLLHSIKRLDTTRESWKSTDNGPSAMPNQPGSSDITATIAAVPPMILSVGKSLFGLRLGRGWSNQYVRG